MNTDGRLSGALHALLHMAEAPHPLTSEALGGCMHAHPVAVRRTMAGLRAAGIVASGKGHGGGWRLARGLEAVSVADVYVALGRPALFALRIGARSPHCPLEQAVEGAVAAELEAAQARLLARLSRITLADLAGEVAAARRAAPHPPALEISHAP